MSCQNELSDVEVLMSVVFFAVWFLSDKGALAVFV